MVDLLGLLFGALAATFLPPAAFALTPLALPLPQNFNTNTYISNQLLRYSFSTDASRQSIAPPATIPPEVKIFITTNQTCVTANKSITYRTTVSNTGPTTAHNVIVQLQYPPGFTLSNTDPQINPASASTQTAAWHLNTLAPGTTTTTTSTFSVTAPETVTTMNGTVFAANNSGQLTEALTNHTLQGVCGQVAAAQNVPKQPTIVCDPSEIGCVDSPIPANKSAVDCNEAGCTTKPALGDRFTEAVADIIPGECRVLADNIIKEPDFQDALNRRRADAAEYLLPLHQSTWDFRQLITANEILGNEFTTAARTTLSAIHTRHWAQQSKVVSSTLEGKQNTQLIRQQIDAWDRAWTQETVKAQQELTQRYTAMQAKRKAKFDPVQTLAITHAQESISRACGQASDGGLGTLLPAVKTAYETNLQRQVETFMQTQQKFVSDDVFANSRQWQQDLRAALDRFDQGDPKLLQNYLANIPTYQQNGFQKAWLATYDAHAIADRQNDNQIRLNAWENALDTPKSMATECEFKKIAPQPIETTWCESGTSAEILAPAADSRPKKGPGVAPASINGGEQANVRDEAVAGEACRDLPDQQPTPDNPFGDDPYWTLNCRCHCGQLVTCGEQLVLCEDYYDKVVAGQCAGNTTDRLLRHDVYVTTQAECFNDTGHQDPFF